MSNEEAPKTSLPSWSDCQSMVSNRDYLIECGAIKNSVLVDDYYEDSNSLNLTPVHEFIYEYDDADPFKSGWFMHRLEMALDYKERTAKPKIKLTNSIPKESGSYYWALRNGEDVEVVKVTRFKGDLVVDHTDIGFLPVSRFGGYWAKVEQDQFEFEG